MRGIAEFLVDRECNVKAVVIRCFNSREGCRTPAGSCRTPAGGGAVARAPLLKFRPSPLGLSTCFRAAVSPQTASIINYRGTEGLVKSRLGFKGLKCTWKCTQ